MDSIQNDKHDFIRVNFPHGDMVGHTGNLLAVELSVETVDLCLARILKALQKKQGILIVTADHGNADEMFEVGKDGQLKTDAEGKLKPKTSHTLNPVPCYIYDASGNAGLQLAGVEGAGISSLAATSMMCLGFEAPADYDPSLVKFE